MSKLENIRRYRNQIFGLFFLGLILFSNRAEPQNITFGIVILGMLIRVFASGYLIKGKKLTTWGPFSYVRNPLYLGTFIIGIGFCIVQRSPFFLISFSLWFSIVYYFQIKYEERILEQRFGEEYREYCRNVPRFFPRLTPYGRHITESNIGFNFHQVWKNKGMETVGQIIAAFLLLEIRENILFTLVFHDQTFKEIVLNYFRHVF